MIHGPPLWGSELCAFGSSLPGTITMMWGCSFIHFSPGGGVVAKGSVLLAVLPPCNMYPIPGSVGLKSFLAIHASTHSRQILSTHMGSFPGVLGSSGKQVHSFVPLRRTVGGSPSRAGQSRMVAFFETVGGAALIAFWIFHAALLAAGAGVWAAPEATTTSSTEAMSSESILTWFMGCLLEKSGTGFSPGAGNLSSPESDPTRARPCRCTRTPRSATTAA